MSSRSNEVPGVLKVLAPVFWIGLATNAVSAWSLSSPSWRSADFWMGLWTWLIICNVLILLFVISWIIGTAKIVNESVRREMEGKA